MTAPLALGIVCFPTLGGSGVIASELALGLAQRGHHVHLLASALPARASVPQERLTFHEVRAPDYPLFEHAPYTLALAGKIAEVVRREQLDLVQVHYAVPHATSAWLAREALGDAAPKFVVSLHGTDVTRVGPEPAYREITSLAVSRADGVTVPSEFLRHEAHGRLGIPESRQITVLSNFVETELFAPPPSRDRRRLDALFNSASDGPVLFHVSNFREVKRVGDLFEVLVRVRREVDARLVLVGDGPELEGAQRRVSSLGLLDSVRFLGRRQRFAEELGHADAFLLPSESESFGVAALEALSCGVPVVGYRVGGVPELVTSDVGRLVEPFDVDGLARETLQIVTNPSLRESLGRNARERALARYRRGPALERYETYFRDIVRGTR